MLKEPLILRYPKMLQKYFRNLPQIDPAVAKRRLRPARRHLLNPHRQRPRRIDERGLASLRVQNNEMTLDEAGKFHAGWTPRGWSAAKSKLVGFEQLLYLRQPGYGPSNIVGKSQLDKMIARASHHAEASSDGRAERSSLRVKPFNLQQTFAAIWASGIVPPSVIDREFLERLR